MWLKKNINWLFSAYNKILRVLLKIKKNKNKNSNVFLKPKFVQILSGLIKFMHWIKKLVFGIFVLATYTSDV